MREKRQLKRYLKSIQVNSNTIKANTLAIVIVNENKNE